MKIVIPGEKIAIAEEFDAGENTYREGNYVYASAAGKVEYNKKDHIVSVVAEKSVKPFSEGDKVYARVITVRENRAIVKLLAAFQGLEERVLTQSFAAIFIGNVDNRFIKDMKEEFRIGDYVIAEVADIKPYGVYLRTNKPSLGVIKAFCSNCRNALRLKGDKLYCEKCKKFETRKISAEYILK